MIDTLVGFLPDKLILICAFTAFFVPYLVHKINHKLHEIGDPQWKKEEQRTKGNE